MVTVKQLECAYSFLKLNSTEELKCHIMPLKGTNAPLYRLRAHLSKEAGSFGGIPSNAEGQNLLGTLLLAQWEDRAWKGQLKYDVTNCETKVIFGGKKFIAQLNEQWSSNSLALFENADNQPLGSSRMTNVKICRDNILLCITRGENASPELIPSSVLPQDGTLVFVNANPIEYGHIYLVPYKFYNLSEILDKGSLEYINEIAVELDDCFFRMFYDYAPSVNPSAVYFQANFFASVLPVELQELIPVYGDSLDRGMQICEVAGYPIKTLVFTSRDNPKLLAGVMSEICSVLQQHNAVFSILISDCARKFFLFPQAQSSSATNHLSAWECGGYFIFNTNTEFDDISEEEISNRLASVSLDNQDFQALKQLCCCVANKVVVP